MMIQRPDQRVAVFIDTQNMYHSAKHVFNSKVSFSALVEAVVGSRMMSRAIAYVAKSKGGDESAFFEALLSSGIELKIKDVQEFSSGAKKADWDVGMAVDAISIASKVDVIVLATGDGDFVPLVEYLKAHGVICEVAAFAESTNARLREVADAFMDLSSEPDRFLIGYRGRRKAEKEETEKPSRRKGARRESPPEDNASSRIRITH
ncbi:NYN domain-containing protein [Candidatus Uhrbacteria bacterium]|jgi:uncharacterized LabA/DUF88 family protein|nr:MAG: NYN domain-containing protein [Candidatus Uhrbacteria bacterium]